MYIFDNICKIFSPAPLSLISIFSDIVILEDLLADLNDEYKTHSIQITNPITSKFPEDLPPNRPQKPGLHSSENCLISQTLHWMPITSLRRSLEKYTEF